MNMLLDEKAIAGNPWFHTCALSAPVKAVVNYSGSLQLFYRLSERFERGTVMAIKTYQSSFPSSYLRKQKIFGFATKHSIGGLK